MDKNKAVMAFILCLGIVAALTVRERPADTLFDETGTFGSSKVIDFNGQEYKVWMLAREGEIVCFGRHCKNSWSDTTTQYMVQSGSQTQTNIPLAATELTGTYRVIGDFTNKEEIRFGLSLAVNGSINSRAYVQYSLTGANWFNISRNDSTISLAGVVPITRTTSWEQLPIGTQATDVILRVMTVNGDGVADPQYRGGWIETR